MSYPKSIDLIGLGQGGAMFQPATPGATSGNAFSAGDLNGDGFDDMALSSTADGAIYVVFGGHGQTGTVKLGDLDGDDGFRFTGLASVTRAGDFNGDGLDDLLFGGKQFIVSYGREDFPAALGIPTNDDANSYVDPVSTHHYPTAIGDINGDGFADVSLYDIDPYYAYGSSAFIVFGAADGATHATTDVANPFGDIEFFARAGDVNGDGVDDFVTGDRGGRTVVFGSTDLPSQIFLNQLTPDQGFDIAVQSYDPYYVGALGDINGDGFGDLKVGTTVIFGGATGVDIDPADVDGTNGFKVVGGEGMTVPGLDAVGDVNGDGFDDFAFYERGDKHRPAGVYVVFGRAKPFDATLVVSHLNGKNGFEVVDSAGGLVSASSTGAIDFNGDGLADLMISGQDAHHVFHQWVVYGLAPDEAVNRIGTAASQHLVGGAFDDRLSGLGGDDTLIGGRGADLLSGGEGADVFRFTTVADSATAHPDTIKDLKDGDVIDLSGVDANASLSGDQAFVLVKSFNHHAGQARLVWHADTQLTALEGDINGDGLADFTVLLKGHHSFHGTDLVL